MGLGNDATDVDSTVETFGLGPSLAAHFGGNASRSAEFVEVFQALIDALPEQIALVDDQWTILAVNPAWTQTAALYGYELLRPGANYAEFCAAKAGEGHNAARPAVDGIKEIDAGTRKSFHYAYDGNDRWEGRTFRLEINRLRIGERIFATITRYDVTELVELRRMRASLGSSLREGQESERRRIARDLHDSTQQMLVSVSLGIGQLKRASKNQRVRDTVQEIEQGLADVQQEIRSFVYLAHPPVLENLGLRNALEQLVEGYGRRTGLGTSFHSETKHGDTWPAAETAVYRFVQEALSNVHRHAHASRMDVGLFYRKSMIHAVVTDDGIGMPATAPLGVGVAGMKERFTDLGGRLFVKPQERGTRIIASVPKIERIRSEAI